MKIKQKYRFSNEQRKNSLSTSWFDWLWKINTWQLHFEQEW